MKLVHLITLLLVLVGGLNWGLVALLDVNLVTTVLGTGVLTTLVYVLVMIATFYTIFPKLTEGTAD